MIPEPRQFTAFSRLLHWIMAVMIVTMLAIGVAMVASLADYHWLASIHRPLGIAILAMVVVRLVNRLASPIPPYPTTMTRAEKFIARSSEYLMYGLMIALPLVGWGMLSAARYPVVLYGSVHLPFILPHNAMSFAMLRKTHTVLAYSFFAAILAHFSAILFHTFVVRDRIFDRMAPWRIDASSKNACSSANKSTSA